MIVFMIMYAITAFFTWMMISLYEENTGWGGFTYKDHIAMILLGVFWPVAFGICLWVKFKIWTNWN